MNVQEFVNQFFEKFHSLYNDFEKNITRALCDEFNLKENRSYRLLKEYADNDPQSYMFHEINDVKYENGFKIINFDSKNLLNLIPKEYLNYIVFNCDQILQDYSYPSIEDINDLLFEIEDDFKRRVVFSHFLRVLEFELDSLKLSLKLDSRKLEDLINHQKFSVLRIFSLALISNYESVYKDEINLFCERYREKYELYNLNDYKSKSISDKKHFSTYWFITGVNFANGKIFDYLEQNLSANKIALELGNRNLRPYITESLSIKKSDKNIFSNSNKVGCIIEYFNDNNLEIDRRFLLKIK